VKKPRAFYRLQYRDALLPDATYQRIWQHLDATLAPADACKRMVGALKLAAEHECQEALGAHWLAALQPRPIPHAQRPATALRTESHRDAPSRRYRPAPAGRL
jgi:hypothetical protein